MELPNQCSMDQQFFIDEDRLLEKASFLDLNLITCTSKLTSDIQFVNQLLDVVDELTVKITQVLSTSATSKR